MRVMLLKDVYNLGRAGDVEEVADGYGRNYLIPQGLAVKATQGTVKQAERIAKRAAKERARLNEELSALAEQLEGLELAFPVKASETGRLYGSIHNAMIAEAIEARLGVQVDRHKIDTQPIKELGVHEIPIRLTLDLVPEVKILVHREGEPPESAYEVEVTEEEKEAPEIPGYLEEFLEAEEPVGPEETQAPESDEA
jgi:large subunit ribosomal protein L9